MTAPEEAGRSTSYQKYKKMSKNEWDGKGHFLSQTGGVGADTMLKQGHKKYSISNMKGRTQGRVQEPKPFDNQKSVFKEKATKNDSKLRNVNSELGSKHPS